MPFEILHRRTHDGRTDRGALTFGNDPHAVFAAEAKQRLTPLRPVGAFQRRAQRLQLHDLGVAELLGDQRRAVTIEYRGRRQRGQRDDDHQQKHEPPEQRARPQRHDGLPSDALASLAVAARSASPPSGTYT